MTMAQMKDLLETNTEMTVYRKLKELAYLRSYSHNGMYYTLPATAKFSDLGLWERDGIYFSKYGSLIDTLDSIVTVSDMGYFETELENLLNVVVRVPLCRLIQSDRIGRSKLGRRFLYGAADERVRNRQLVSRQDKEAEEQEFEIAGSRVLYGEIHAAMILFAALLDEKQRRIYAGLESLKVGHGGDKRVSDLLGISAQTVAKGREELINRDIEVDRVRREGGGRHSVEKKLRS
jgi:hypothetical protein